MTQEEKAKAYDEALEKAKDCLKDGTITSTAIDYIETIFPELKESEDEKMRKALIRFFQWFPYDRLNAENLKPKEAIAWLEKQGGKDKLIKELGEYKVKYTQEVLSQQLEKQCEKMKAKSEVIKDYTGEENVWNNACDFRPKHMQRCLCYDKYMGGVYCYIYDDISKYWCTQTTEEHDADGDNHICDYADYRVTVWMCLPKTTFYPEKQGKQKPTSDIKYKVSASGSLSIVNGKPFDYEHATITQKDFAPKQEWSEDDETMRENIEGALDCYESMVSEDWEREKEWLKSLKERITWKPSKEQIQAFEQVYEWYNDNFAPSETLTSLYNDLKKL